MNYKSYRKVAFVVAIFAVLFLSACERTDYQHPIHRYHQQNNK
ncbi:hypothetical protein ACWIUD_10070 [Helicobacter sp. 23-1044]